MPESLANTLRAIALLSVALAFPGTATAQGVRNFCASAKEQLSLDAQLDNAAKAAFPNADVAAREDECLYPYKLLRYGDADVLLVAGNKPGEACYGCGANLSAYVLARSPGRSKVVAHFVDFTSSGTFGDPGQIDAIQLAGHDAFAIESGGTFQGYTASRVAFFFFDRGRLIELKPALPLAAENGGAMTDERKVISVDGSWRVDPARPDAITISYKVKARGRERRSETTWIVKDTALTLASGRVPPEYGAAGGE